MMDSEQLLQEAEAHVKAYFAENVRPEYVFHDLEHTMQTVAASRNIGEGFQLSDKEMCLLLLATWFHDTGYAQGAENHEERSCQYATAFLENKITPEELKVVLACIRTTKVPQTPETLLERIICDADLSHLGMKTYWDRNGKLRQEFILTRKIIMSEPEWLDFEVEFMLRHEYHTTVAKELFNKRKVKHIQQLFKLKRRVDPKGEIDREAILKIGIKDSSIDLQTILPEEKEDIHSGRFGRGVETMYRTTYRTHTSLSQMADSKANLMLSVNAIVISILVSNLLPKLEDNPKLIIPSILLTLTCLGSMIYATLSTRPKVTEGKVTKEAIQQRKANLLFFGNFHSMPLDEFQWGVNEMLQDPEFLYSSMSRDLYFLGIVLAQKYRYLSICYNLFMYGLIISVTAFGLTFVL